LRYQQSLGERATKVNDAACDLMHKPREQVFWLNITFSNHTESAELQDESASMSWRHFFIGKKNLAAHTNRHKTKIDKNSFWKEVSITCKHSQPSKGRGSSDKPPRL
jgi:hypothetical protein